MAKKIRVYELARELGLTNKEGLELCLAMGIGVKSHSSSIEEAQADRVRRKAEREGLKREHSPAEEGPYLPVPAQVTAAAPQPAPATRPGGDAEHAQRPLAVARTTAPVPAPASVAGAPSVVHEQPRREGVGTPQTGTAVAAGTQPGRGRTGALGEDASAHRAGQTGAPVGAGAHPQVASPPARQRPLEQRPSQAPAPGPRPAGPRPAVAPPGVRAATGSPTRAHSDHETGRPAARAAAPSQGSHPGGGSPQARQAQPPVQEGGADGQGPARGAVSPMTGKPIPPPPGFRRPLSPLTGKPIPPPARGPAGGEPGRGAGQYGQGRPPGPGARPYPQRSGPGGPMARGGGMGGGPRPGGAPGGQRPGAPGAGGAAGRPGGGPGMRPGGARPLGARGAPGTRGPDATYRPAPGGAGGFRGAPGAGMPPRGGGRPGGGPGGPGGRGRPSGRRSRSRRASREELEAQAPTTYVPSHAPVPDGEVIVERGSTAQDLAPRLNRSAADVVRFLFSQGEMVTATMSLSDDMIELFAAEIGANVRLVEPGEQKEAELQARYFGDEDENANEELLRPRPPVVTVMGHVDHGKTSLLDRIRESDVASGETGGITQHIGAYQVTTPGGAVVTFIDTPGHEAFTSMRARGAEVTDIVVLVVAADDGVMPQTVEALHHAKAAGVPIVVAINKIDRADADPNHVMQQLSEHGLVPERWGGETIMVEVSALQNLGVDDLLEQILVVAEVEELRANPEGRARGVVLEANLDPGKGPVATVMVQGGTLRVGDHIVAGAAWGRVKALIDDKGDNIKEAPPSFPAQVLGFDSVPAAGDELRGVASSKTAREVAEQREQRFRSADLRRSSAATSGGAKLEDIFEQIQRGEAATLNLVVKADVQGSLEAVTESLRKLERDEVKVAFVNRAVGGITENDVQLAAASNATIIGFNVRPNRRSRELAEAHRVEIRTYEIIYKLIEDIEAAMVGMLAPTYEEVVTGEAEVREVFRIPRVGAVAGCYVRDGTITRGSKVRFLRDGVVIWRGTINSLRRFKEDVREVQSGFECGVGLSDYQDLRQGDVIETFEEREIARS